MGSRRRQAVSGGKPKFRVQVKKLGMQEGPSYVHPLIPLHKSTARPPTCCIQREAAGLLAVDGQDFVARPDAGTLCGAPRSGRG